MIPIVVGALGTVPKGLEKMLEVLERNYWNIRNNLDHNSKIGQNTEKSPGDMRRLAIPQTLVKDHQP